MKSFPVYCFFNLLSDLLATFDHPHVDIYYFFFTIFELVYFSYFFSQIIHSRRIKQLVWILNGLMLLFVVYLNIIKGRTVADTGAIVVLVECCILIIPCFVYFREIFSKPKTLNLTREPSFWMVTGILFYFFLLIPVTFIASYYSFIRMPEIASVFYSINNYSQMISYILFVKAMTCWKKKSY